MRTIEHEDDGGAFLLVPEHRDLRWAIEGRLKFDSDAAGGADVPDSRVRLGLIGVRNQFVSGSNNFLRRPGFGS
jgi:hypothetical protein